MFDCHYLDNLKLYRIYYAIMFMNYELNQQNKAVNSKILAFRNDEKSFLMTLESFDGQSMLREKWEIILIDGLSCDNSRAIAQIYVNRDDNGRLLVNTYRIATCGWNIGIEDFSGRYIAITGGYSLMEKLISRKPRIFLADLYPIVVLHSKLVLP